MGSSGPRLYIRRLTFAAACDFVEREHRHHRPPQGHMFSLGVATETGVLVGAAIIGRPVARHFDDGLTVEVTRLATDGTPNACSALYAAAWRTARSAGNYRALTYTQDGESGASLRGAGWREVKHLPARPGWNAPSRPRTALGTENVARTLWEITTGSALPLSLPRDETRDETRPRRTDRRCPECRAPLLQAPTGRPAHYCGPSCRQRAYRRRQRTAAGATGTVAA
jgi:hypothetical protein